MIAFKLVYLITIWGCWVGASIPIAYAQTSLVELTGQINQAKGVLKITLINKEDRPYAFSLGGMFGPYEAPAFQFSISGINSLDGLVDYSHEGSGMIGGRADFWIVPLPSGAYVTMDLPLERLSLRKNFKARLSSLLNQSWTLRVRFQGQPQHDFYLLWPRGYSFQHSPRAVAPELPFWTGIAETSVINKPYKR